MNYSKYYEARDIIESILKDDLIGPVYEDEIIHEPPVSCYVIGKLYPKNIIQINDEQHYLEAEEQIFSEEELLSLGNGRYPSAMGITFAVSKSTLSFCIDTSAAYYVKAEGESSWQRHKLDEKYRFDLAEILEEKTTTREIAEYLQLQIRAYDFKSSQDIKLSATLVNSSTATDYKYETLSSATYFQPKMSVHSLESGVLCDLSNPMLAAADEEAQGMELLYHECHTYAIGHGCSVSWGEKEDGTVDAIRMEIMPDYELQQMRPASCITGDILSMRFLAEASREQLVSEITRFAAIYGSWISKTEKAAAELDSCYRAAAARNMAACRAALSRISAAAQLMEDDTVFRAFRYANETMLMQRKCYDKNAKDEAIQWYPFQLAFFLQELESIVKPDSKDREQVDLLWFPTGGGKTEAYLGIAAFVLFFRRLRENKSHGEDAGVAIIMRYTLRLLSFQQFERASAMICAAEVIRRREGIEGKDFGIALWAGSDLLPNSLVEADKYINKFQRVGITSPVQVTRCPYCGERISDRHYRIDITNKRMRIDCPNGSCPFHTGLPIHLIDEDIYEHKPSFVVATIDKFATLSFNDKAGELLGIDLAAPPELIIQDELHLISGPLGTITGLYEAAITHLCERDGVKPKIIASTATIRNASQQIKGLYGKGLSQFPPQGISVKDSFFAELSDRDKKAARKYTGILASGISRATTFVRVCGAMLFASRYLRDAGFSDEVVDAFWTETGYFNTLRELGSAIVRILDNVQDQYDYLRKTKLAEKYPTKEREERFNRILELTSRRDSAEIGIALESLMTQKYRSDSTDTPLDFLIASNMISVGVDISRLNNMIVVGQPIKASEYVQSTSRVGRSTPGLVMVMYHPNLSRDRSYYESFVPFHQSMYKHVEATSLTPFADRSRDRALQALYIILCRYSIPSLRRNEGASEFSSNDPRLNEIRQYISDYVSIVDPAELERVMADIAEIEQAWDDAAAHSSKLKYYSRRASDDTLFDPDYEENSRFRMMRSMRSVEPSVSITTLE